MGFNIPLPNFYDRISASKYQNILGMAETE